MFETEDPLPPSKFDGFDVAVGILMIVLLAFAGIGWWIK